MSESHLLSFFLAVLDELAVPHESVEPGVHELVLPPGEAARLGLPEQVRVTADPEAIQDGASAELLSFGAPLLDWAIAQAVPLGCVSRTFVAARSVDLAACTAKLERALELDHARVRQLTPRGFRLGQVLELHALVRLTSDVAEELRVAVFVDATTALPLLTWEATDLASLDLRSEPVFQAPARPARPLAELVARGRARAEERLAPRLESMRRDLAARQQRDGERLARYFAEQRADLKRRRLGPDTLAARMAALDAEEGVRRTELKARAGTTAALTVDRLTFHEVPKAVFTLELEAFAQTLRLAVAVDLATGRPDPLACPHCNLPTLFLAGQRDGPPRCAACRPAPPPPAPPPPVVARAAAPATTTAPRPQAPSPPPIGSMQRQREFLSAASGLLSGNLRWLGFLVSVSSDATRKAVDRGRQLRRLDAEAIAKLLEQELWLPGIRDVARDGDRYRGHGAGVLLGDRLASPRNLHPAWDLGDLRDARLLAVTAAAAAPRGTCARTFGPTADSFPALTAPEWSAMRGRDGEMCCLALPFVELSAAATGVERLRAEAFLEPCPALASIVRVLCGALGVSGRSSWLAPAFWTQEQTAEGLQAMAEKAVAHLAGTLFGTAAPPTDRFLIQRTDIQQIAMRPPPRRKRRI